MKDEMINMMTPLKHRRRAKKRVNVSLDAENYTKGKPLMDRYQITISELANEVLDRVVEQLDAFERNVGHEPGYYADVKLHVDVKVVKRIQ